MKKRESTTNTNRESSSSFLLWLLLSGDCGYILLHILFKSELLLNNYFSVRRELGYSEFFQYTKFLWSILLLIYIIKETHKAEFSAWLAVFIYFLADDAFQMREKIAKNLSNAVSFTPPFNLRLQDIGELAVSLMAGAILFTLLLWAYQRGNQNFKSISIDLFMLFLLMVFFGVFFDMAEISADLGIFVEEALGLIDDGGEMIVSSFMVWYIFKLAIHNGRGRNFIHQRFLGAKKEDKDKNDSLA